MKLADSNTVGAANCFAAPTVLLHCQWLAWAVAPVFGGDDCFNCINMFSATLPGGFLAFFTSHWIAHFYSLSVRAFSSKIAEKFKGGWLSLFPTTKYISHFNDCLKMDMLYLFSVVLVTGIK